jgi:hypothetical protein
LLIGLDPAVGNCGRWPGLSAEKRLARGQREAALTNESGYAADICFIAHGQAAEDVVKAGLAGTDFGCILIGAGVRTDKDQFLRFERLVDVVNRQTPGAWI